MASHLAFGQLEPFQDQDAIITPAFRDRMIKAKKITQITVKYFSKPDGAPIGDGGIIHQYFFDTTGKMTKSMYLQKEGKKWDTVTCTYLYENNNLVVKRKQIGDFYDTWYYKWNKDTMLQNEYHVQETNDTGKDATRKIISADSFAYIVYPKQTQQYTYNEEHKIFRKTIIQYDDDRHFVSRNCSYAVGSLYAQVDVQYDSLGKMIGYINTDNLNGDIHKKTMLKYDTHGNVAEENVWEDDKQTHRMEYLYDKANELVSDELDRDIAKAIIYILRFSYNGENAPVDNTHIQKTSRRNNSSRKRKISRRST